jgi:hypothetical protein
MSSTQRGLGTYSVGSRDLTLKMSAIAAVNTSYDVSQSRSLLDTVFH